MSEVILHLHIPKVGGTTLRTILFEQYSSGDYSEAEDGLLKSGIYYYPWEVLAPSDTTVTEPVRRALGRDDLRAVLGHFWFGIHPYVNRPATYITLLRDPADRLVSLYYLLTKWPDRYGFARGTGFHDFVTTGQYREVYNDQTRRIAGMEPGEGGGGRAVLERAKENLQRHFSVVGTMERFDETLLLLKQRLGWKKNMIYYPQRQNVVRMPVNGLPESTREAIRERSALDYELYEFANAMLQNAVTQAGAVFHRELEALQTAQVAMYEKMAWKTEETRANRQKIRQVERLSNPSVP